MMGIREQLAFKTELPHASGDLEDWTDVLEPVASFQIVETDMATISTVHEMPKMPRNFGLTYLSSVLEV